MKILYHPETGKLWGGQAVGFDGVDKRVDVLAAYVRMGGTVHDLASFEQAYAPPFSSAKDPLNVITSYSIHYTKVYDAVCPVCAGMPGVLPVVNRKAVAYAIKVALALECEISLTSIFARKNYFYPDLV